MNDFPVYYYVCAAIVAIATLVLLLVKAPKGYEDEEGFHLGEPPKPPIEDIAPEPEAPFPNAVQTGIILEDGGKLILIRHGIATVVDKSDLGLGD